MLGPTYCVLYLLAPLALDLLRGRSSFSSTGSLALAAPAAPTADFGWLTTDEPEWLPRNLTSSDLPPFAEEQQEEVEEHSLPAAKSEKSVVITQDDNKGKPEPGDEQAQSAAQVLDEVQTPTLELEAGEQDTVEPDAAHNGIALQGHNKAVIGCHWVGDVRNCLGKAKPPPTHYDLCRCPWFRGCLKKLKELKKLKKLKKLGRPPKGVAAKEKEDPPEEVKVGRDE